MQYVNPNDVMRLFKKYIRDYQNGTLTYEIVEQELSDAIDSADYQEIDD